MKVEQLMTRNVKTCTAHDTLATAARMIWGCGVVPIVVTGNGDAAAPVVGTLTDRELCMEAYTQGRPLCEIPVGSAMSRTACTCRPADTLDVALEVMKKNKIHQLPVVDAEDCLIGMLSLADIAREAA